MLKKLSLGLIMGLLVLVGSVQAQEKKDIVLSMMEKAVAHYKAVGQDQAFKDFNKPGEFKNGEYYVIGQSLTDGKIIFDGVNAKLIGKDLTKVKDTDGKVFVQEMLDLAKSDGKGWVSYKWPNPATKKIAQKYAYVTRINDDVFLIIGYYE